MITEIAGDLLPDFLQVNRTRCFLHIINLVAKTLLKQFDVPKKDADKVLDEAERALRELAQDIDLEEMMTRINNAGDGSDGDEDDDIEGWVDEMELLSNDEREDLSEKIGPVRLVLAKAGHQTDL
jgi:hypothetical protein